MILIMLGPPGAGKGTQTSVICDKYNIVSLATGDMLRDAVASKSPLGEEVKNIIASGDLVSDEIIERIITERIKEDDCKNGFILDGAVRTLKQAEMIDNLLSKQNLSLDAVIELRVDFSLLLERIKNRIKLSEVKREDDNEDVLINRLEVYKKQTEPLVPFYQSKNLLHIVDGALPIEKVTENISKIIEKF